LSRFDVSLAFIHLPLYAFLEWYEWWYLSWRR
jgi:hypothetical protein